MPRPIRRPPNPTRRRPRPAAPGAAAGSSREGGRVRCRRRSGAAASCRSSWGIEMGYFANATAIIIEVIFGLAVLLFALRVLLQLVRANFHNPICQFAYKATNP